MGDRRVIVDASVVVKWFHDEPKTAEALNLQESVNSGTVTATVPDLLLYEVANALVRGVEKSAPALIHCVAEESSNKLS